MENKKKDVSLTQEQIDIMVHDTCVLFCKYCGCGIPRDTYLEEPLTVEEVRELSSLGWSLGYDFEYDEEIMAPWLNSSEYTDEELMKLWNEYKTIHKYA